MKDERHQPCRLEEFDAFLSSKEVRPPDSLSNAILSRVQADLNPAPWRVFSKLALIQVVAGSLTLLFCPQFGVSFTSSMGLMPVLMKYGEPVCMFGCGALFLGGSALAASLILRPEEVNVIRRHELLHFVLLASLSLGGFLCALGTSLFAALTLVWLLGSIAGGSISLELGWLIRSRFRKRVAHGV